MITSATDASARGASIVLLEILVLSACAGGAMGKGSGGYSGGSSSTSGGYS